HEGRRGAAGDGTREPREVTRGARGAGRKGASPGRMTLRCHAPLGGEWGEQDSNLRRLSQRVYSPSPLTTRTSPRAVTSGDSRAGRRLRCVAQTLRLGQRLQALQGGVLDLADPLAGHAERAADLLE